MCRQIEFRGYDVEDKAWRYGYYVYHQDTTYCFSEDYENGPDVRHHYIIWDEMTDWGLPNRWLKSEVDGKSISQFSGFKDRNKKKVYDGDIVNLYGYFTKLPKGCVKWDEKCCSYIVIYEGGVIPICNFRSSDIEVIGNVYENPEMLEAKQNE